MKTNFFYLAVAIATTSLFCYSESAGAQAIIVEEDVSVTEVVPTKPRYYSDSHKNNWFISIGAGGQTFLTEHVGDNRNPKYGLLNIHWLWTSLSVNGSARIWDSDYLQWEVLYIPIGRLPKE